MKSQQVRVVLPVIQDADGYPPVNREGVWVSIVEPGIGIVDSIPFFARAATYQDRVRFGVRGDEFVFEGMVASSGNALIRVLCYPELDSSELDRAIRAFGADTEYSKQFDLLSVSMPPSADLAALQAFLARGEDEGRLGYEEAILPKGAD